MTTSLHALLAAADPTDEEERFDLAQQRAYATSLDAPFSRHQWPAHFTGSAVVVDPQGERVVLVLHAKLGRWLQPGGHADPSDAGDLLLTALREAREETALDVSPHPRAPTPLDVDVHRIPARGNEPEHRHLDVRFLLVARDPDALKHDPHEAHGAQWLTWNEAMSRADEPALVRLLTKARAIAASR
jgi:8-oxo-dGTP pyrophosphatase MutT (NUDIX family)